MRKISTYLLVLWITIGPTGMALAEIPEVCSREPNPIVVTVHGVRSDKGTLKAKLYGDNPDDFLRKGKKIDSHRVSAKKNTTVLCLYVPQPGMYAIAVHHDENGNKKAIVIPISVWNKIQEELEELEDIRAYDEAKSKPSNPIPFEEKNGGLRS